jgi:hypothetical protein
LRTLREWETIPLEVYLANCSPVGEHLSKPAREIRLQRNTHNKRWAQRQNQEAYDVGPDYWAEHFKISKARIELFHIGHDKFLTKVDMDRDMLNHIQANWWGKQNHPLMKWWRTSDDFAYVTNTFSVMDLEERSELLLCIAAYMRYFRIGNKDKTNLTRTALLDKETGTKPVYSQWDAITIQDMCYFFSQITHPFGLNTNRRHNLGGPSPVKGIGQITKHDSGHKGSRVNLHPSSRRDLKWYVETLSTRVFRLIKIEWAAGQTPLNQQQQRQYLLRHPGTQLQAQTCMNLILSLFGGEGGHDMGGFPTYIQNLRVGATNYDPNNDAENADDKIFWHNQNVLPLKQILNSHNGGSKRRKKRKTKRRNRKKGTKRTKKRKKRKKSARRRRTRKYQT